MTTETFKLSHPIKTHEGDKSELTLKAPRARAFVEWNDPFQIKPRLNEAGEQVGGFDFVFNNKAMIRFLSDMTGVDDLVLNDLSASDFLRLRGLAANMILETVPDKNPSDQSVA